MAQPFSEWRFAHNRFIFLPRTLVSVAPVTKPHRFHDHDVEIGTSDLDPRFAEAAFDSLDVTTDTADRTCYCADALRTFWHGA